MSLVERLRGTRWVGTAFHSEATEAADAIERLRAALEGVIAVADRKTDEFEKARAALAATTEAGEIEKAQQAGYAAVVEENKRWRKLIGNIVWVCNGTKNAETVEEVLKIIRNAGVTLE